MKKKNELISRKHNKVCPTLNYNENIIILALRLLELFYFLLLESKSINQWLRIQKKKHEKIVLLVKANKKMLNSIQFFISKSLTDSNISHNEYVLINNVLKEK